MPHALLIAAAMLVRNNLSLAEAERARANEAAILQATVDTVREGIAYFTSEGLLCAFNSNFFRRPDLPALREVDLDLPATQSGDGRRLAPDPRLLEAEDVSVLVERARQVVHREDRRDALEAHMRLLATSPPPG